MRPEGLAQWVDEATFSTAEIVVKCVWIHTFESEIWILSPPEPVINQRGELAAAAAAGIIKMAALCLVFCFDLFCSLFVDVDFKKLLFLKLKLHHVCP